MSTQTARNGRSTRKLPPPQGTAKDQEEKGATQPQKDTAVGVQFVIETPMTVAEFRRDAEGVRQGFVRSEALFTRMARELIAGKLSHSISIELSNDKVYGEYPVTTVDGTVRQKHLRKAIVQAVNMAVRRYSTPKGKDGKAIPNAKPTLSVLWDTTDKGGTPVGLVLNHNKVQTNPAAQQGARTPEGKGIAGGDTATTAAPLTTESPLPEDSVLLSMIDKRLKGDPARLPEFGQKVLAMLQAIGLV